MVTCADLGPKDHGYYSWAEEKESKARKFQVLHWKMRALLSMCQLLQWSLASGHLDFQMWNETHRLRIYVAAAGLGNPLSLISTVTLHCVMLEGRVVKSIRTVMLKQLTVATQINQYDVHCTKGRIWRLLCLYTLCVHLITHLIRLLSLPLGLGGFHHRPSTACHVPRMLGVVHTLSDTGRSPIFPLCHAGMQLQP